MTEAFLTDIIPGSLVHQRLLGVVIYIHLDDQLACLFADRQVTTSLLSQLFMQSLSIDVCE